MPVGGISDVRLGSVGQERREHGQNGAMGRRPSAVAVLFPVAELAAATAKVHAAGGRVMSPTTLPSGETVAPCEDPQGAALRSAGLSSGAFDSVLY